MTNLFVIDSHRGKLEYTDYVYNKSWTAVASLTYDAGAKTIYVNGTEWKVSHKKEWNWSYASALYRFGDRLAYDSFWKIELSFCYPYHRYFRLKESFQKDKADQATLNKLMWKIKEVLGV